jgi:hypothetical protein
MTRSWIIAVVAAAGIFFLAGCGRYVGEGPPDPSGRTTSSEAPSEPGAKDRTVTHQEEPFVPKPPDSTLSFGDQTVIGTLGSFCWTGGCGDARTLVPPKREALTVSAGSVMVFDFGGSRRLASIGAVAYPLGRGNEVRKHHSLRFLEPGEGRRLLATEDLKILREGDRAEIPAELPKGEYVVQVHIRLPGGEGDAVYYFRVAMEGDAGERATAEQTSNNELECPSGMGVGSFFDYAPGAKGEKASPVELARRDFSKQIEGGDIVELANHARQGDTETVRVVRDGRVVALVEYGRVGGGWLRDHYEACTDF